VAHAAVELVVRHVEAFVLLLDVGLGNDKCEHVAGDHHHAHRRRPGECGRSSCSKKVREHVERGSDNLFSDID